MRLQVSYLLVAAGLLGACSDDHGRAPAFVPASSDPRRNIMVIDEGFDLSVGELQGAVSAAFTITCADDGGGLDAGAGSGGDGGTPSFDDAKQQLLAQLGTPDDSCRWSEGITTKPDPLASIAKYHDRWNAAIRGEKFLDIAFTDAERMEILTALMPELETYNYHGTSTAGTVAHDDAGVRLVLVERALDSEGGFDTTFTCERQDDLDLTVALMRDPDVRAAFLQRPSPVDAALNQALDQYQVGLVNESFGSPSRATLDMLQAMNGCAPVDWGPYYTTTSELERSSAQMMGGRAVLTVKSAGNDGAEVDSPADLIECDPGDPLNLLVGSYDVEQVRSVFSNFGACVDLYAPGEQIIAPYAGDWLLAVDGTSFAAPLTARLVSVSGDGTPFDPAAARTQLLAQRLPDSSISIDRFPHDFFYLPGDTAKRSGALTAAGAPSIGGAMARRIPRRYDLRRTLAPLRLVQRLLRR